jgi:hypothetical protein
MYIMEINVNKFTYLLIYLNRFTIFEYFCSQNMVLETIEIYSRAEGVNIILI